jgi:hypothetical protein
MSLSRDGTAHPGFANLNAEELISLRFRSISDLDYETACAVDAHLLRSREEESAVAITTVFTELIADVDHAIRVYHEERAKTASFYRLRLFEARIALDDAFQVSQQRHLEELHMVEKEYALVVLREDRRPVREEIELIAHSRRLALAGEYAQSIETREAVKGAVKSELARRRATVDARFERIRAIVFARQKDELKILNSKLVADLNQIESDRGQAMDQQRKRFIVAIRALKTQAVTKGIAAALSKERKVEVASAINGIVDGRVKDMTGILIDVAWSLAARQRKEAEFESRTGVNASPSRSRPSSRGGSPRKAAGPPPDREEEYR